MVRLVKRADECELTLFTDNRDLAPESTSSFNDFMSLLPTDHSTMLDQSGLPYLPEVKPFEQQDGLSFDFGAGAGAGPGGS